MKSEAETLGTVISVAVAAQAEQARLADELDEALTLLRIWLLANSEGLAPLVDGTKLFLDRTTR